MKVVKMAAPKFELTMGPRKNKWVTINRFTAEKFDLPFSMREVKVNELTHKSIIVKPYWFESDYGYELYNVIRVNDKTITIRPCDQYGMWWGSACQILGAAQRIPKRSHYTVLCGSGTAHP